MQLRTPRCILRPVALADASVLYSALQQPGFSKGMVHKQHIHDLHDAEAYTKKMSHDWRTGLSYFFSVVVPDDAQCIGRMGVSHKSDGRWHLAYWIHPFWQRKGYASECITVVLEAAFALIKADAIVAQCHEWNMPSRRLLETHMKFIGKEGELLTFAAVA